MQIFGIILSDADLRLIAICGVIVMAWVAYLFNDTLSKRNSFRSAANIFRAAIDVDCAIGLYNAFQVDKFRAIFAAHKEAARIFKGHLCGRSKRRFNKAWNEYEKWSNKILTESAHKQDGVYALTLAHEGNIKTELSEHLKSLLQFAEQI